MKPKRHGILPTLVSANRKSKTQDVRSRRAEAGTPKDPQSSIGDSRSEIVLLAVTGKSPAVLTETVWALAHEKPPVVPGRVVVITTASGREVIQRELFDGGVWNRLYAALAARRVPFTGKLRFGRTADDIRVFTRADARGRSVELEDIRTPADNEAAADFLLDKLREFTENEDVQLVCSLAGGRKTMGALLYACLSLIGREDDRLTHVLVNEPFDDPRLQPRFYFPTASPTRHKAPAGQTVSSTAALIELADVPFVPLRKLFPRELGRMPGSFMTLVKQYRSVVQQLADPPRVELAEDEPVASIERRAVPLPATAFALFSFLVDRARSGKPAFSSYKDAIPPFKEFVEKSAAQASNPFHFRHDVARAVTRWDDTDTQDLRKQINAIKTTLQRARIPSAIAQHLLPRKGYFGIRVKL